MSYTKQEFKSGDKLYASQLNAMDEQIALNASTIADKATLENGVIKFWKTSTEESGTDTLLYSVDISSIGGTGGLDLENLTLSVSQVGEYQRLSMTDGTTTKTVDIPITVISDEQIQTAVTEYLNTNPVQSGATTEQANQIAQNTEDIAELKGDLSKQKELFEDTIGTNKINQSDFKWSKNLSTTDGVEIDASESYGVSPFVDLNGVGKINFYTCDSDGSPVGGAYRVFWYKNDKSLLSYETPDMNLENAKTVPTDAKYVRFVFIKYSSRPYYMLVFDTDSLPNYEAYSLVQPKNVVDRFVENEQRITDLENRKVEPSDTTIVTSINRLDNSKVIIGFYNASGKFTETDGFFTVSEPTDITESNGILNVYVCDNSYGRPVASWYSAVFYDADGTFISGQINNEYVSITTSVISNVPANAKYCIPSFIRSSKGSSYMFSFESIQYGYDIYSTKTFKYEVDVEKLRPNKWVGKKVLIIGDSISTSNYRGLADDGQNLPLWKKWDDVLADRLGFTLIKDAISSSGFIVQPTTTQVGEKSICNRVDNYPLEDDYDMIIIFAGINDFLQGVTVGTIPSEDKTTDFISAVDYSVKTLIERFPKARLVAMLPLPIGMFSNPEQNDTSAYVNALIDRYDDYRVPYLDLAHNSGFRPHIQTFKDMFTLRGGSADNPKPDGLHPNQEWDNNYLVPMIEAFINQFI